MFQCTSETTPFLDPVKQQTKIELAECFIGNCSTLDCVDDSYHNERLAFNSVSWFVKFCGQLLPSQKEAIANRLPKHLLFGWC